MSVTIRIPTTLRTLTGGSAQVEVEGATVGEVLGALESAHPGFKERLFDDEGRDVAPRAVRRETRMPGIAVLVAPSHAAVDTLVALRPVLEPAIAFVAEGVPGQAVERLEHADWRVVPLRRAADLPAAWEDAWRSARESARSGGRDAT